MKYVWLVFPTVMTGLALTSVYQKMPIRTEPQVYGWSVPMAIAAMTFIPAFIGYKSGRNSKD